MFAQSLSDIESLGLCVPEQPENDAKSYAVIAGRSNARWWLIPLESRSVTISGLALFQPLIMSAKLIKAAIVILSWLGLSRLWVRQRLFISGTSVIKQYFAEADALMYAYFTGTNSPHRKIAVQIMNNQGCLLGYAKYTRNPQVQKLLEHEAAVLNQLHKLNLQTAYIPNVLFCGNTGAGTLFVTDTLKTQGTRSVTSFTDAHRMFLKSLVDKTSKSPCAAPVIAENLKARVEHIVLRLSMVWQQRLGKALNKLFDEVQCILPIAMSHGDFTPWNTFIVNERLYVFDWEYAEESAPISNDIIHFTLNESKLRIMPVKNKIEIVVARLIEPWTGLSLNNVKSMLIIYLLTQLLLQVERKPEGAEQIVDWDGVVEQALMLDEVLK